VEEIKKSKKQIVKKESMASRIDKITTGQVAEPVTGLIKISRAKKVKIEPDQVAESGTVPLKVSRAKKVKITKNLEKGEKAAAATVKRTPRVKKLVFKDSSEAVKFVAKVADERKADYIKILNVGPRLAITDYFVIIGAGNTRLTRRIAEDIQVNLKKYNIYAMHIEGAAEGNWILIDFDDFVVHIFTDEYRQYYDIERLWRDSKVIRLKASDTDPDEARGDNLKPGTDEYPDEQSLFSDDGIRMEIKDI
jgi:ribosome-associated protein